MTTNPATITSKLRNCLTARELIEQLENCDPDAKVLFVCNYGDYHNTQQALPCGEVIDATTTDDIKESAYSQSGIELVEGGEDDYDDGESYDADDGDPPIDPAQVVIIR